MRFAFRVVEASPKNEDPSHWCPDPGQFPNVNVEATGPIVDVHSSVGQHATLVSQYLAGPNSPAAGICTDIFCLHESVFKQALGDGRVWVESPNQPVNPFPKMLPHDLDSGIKMVVNCSFGDNVAKDFVTGNPSTFHPEQNVFNRLRDYVNATGYLVVAALPDKGMLYDSGYIQNFPGYSPDVIAVGSADLGHEEPDGRKPDCVAYGYTSLTAPQVSALALRLLYEGEQHSIHLTAAQVKELIFLGCDQALTPYSQGHGAINVAKTLTIFKEKYLMSTGDTTTPAPSTPAPTPAAGIKDPTFQTPSVGSGKGEAYKYNPTGSSWTFLGGTGLAGNGSDFTKGNADSPNGSQVAFLQNQGSISQPVTLDAGTYDWSLQWSERKIWGTPNTLEVYIGATLIGRIIAQSDKTYQTLSGKFVWGGGLTSITLKGTNQTGDATVFVSSVSLTKSQIGIDDQKKNLAMSFGGVYDSVNHIYAVPEEKLQALATAAAGLSGSVSVQA